MRLISPFPSTLPHIYTSASSPSFFSRRCYPSETPSSLSSPSHHAVSLLTTIVFFSFFTITIPLTSHFSVLVFFSFSSPMCLFSFHPFFSPNRFSKPSLSSRHLFPYLPTSMIASLSLSLSCLLSLTLDS